MSIFLNVAFENVFNVPVSIYNMGIFLISLMLCANLFVICCIYYVPATYLHIPLKNIFAATVICTTCILHDVWLQAQYIYYSSSLKLLYFLSATPQCFAACFLFSLKILDSNKFFNNSSNDQVIKQGSWETIQSHNTSDLR